MSSSDIGTFPTGNTLSDGTTVGIDAQTGRWFYQKPIDFDAKEGTLSDADAIQIAEQFIADNNLYPLQELGDAKVGTTSTGDATQGTEEILRKNVYFYPEIAGKPVYGTFRICISVSGTGEIVGVDKFANEYTLVDADVEGKNYHEVATSLSENEYTLNAEVAPSSILVDSVSDAFYADPESEYIQPIYVLEGSEETRQKIRHLDGCTIKLILVGLIACVVVILLVVGVLCCCIYITLISHKMKFQFPKWKQKKMMLYFLEIFR